MSPYILIMAMSLTPNSGAEDPRMCLQLREVIYGAVLEQLGPTVAGDIKLKCQPYPVPQPLVGIPQSVLPRPPQVGYGRPPVVREEEETVIQERRIAPAPLSRRPGVYKD